jgi:hypothetical protein
MAFDFFDRKEKTFVSREYLERMLEGTGISQVPLIESCEKISRNQLLGFMKRQVSYPSSSQYLGSLETMLPKRRLTDGISRASIMMASSKAYMYVSRMRSGLLRVIEVSEFRCGDGMLY